MKSIKHSKFRNTGFLFELLVRQVTSDILNGRNKSIAESLLKKYFNSKTELHSELKLYQFLVNEKYNAESRAEKFISAILETRSKLNEKKILDIEAILECIGKTSNQLNEPWCDPLMSSLTEEEKKFLKQFANFLKEKDHITRVHFLLMNAPTSFLTLHLSQFLNIFLFLPYLIAYSRSL